MPGLASIGPALQRYYDVDLAQLGLIFSGIQLGLVLTVAGWGMIADRWGDRVTVAAGLAGAGAALVAAGMTHSFANGVLAFTLGSMLSAATAVASARTAMAWFDATERAFAISIRQMAVPLGGAAGALLLPAVALTLGVRAALLAAAAVCTVGALVALAALGPRPPLRAEARRPTGGLIRDRRQWRLGVAAALIVLAQTSLSAYFVAYLNIRGLPLPAAAGAFLAMQLAAAGLRVAAGRVSDRVRSRIAPMRWFALGAVAVLAAAAAGAGWPVAVVGVLLVAAIVLSMSCVAITYAASGEMAGASRAGLAMGFQITILAAAGAVAPAAFGALTLASGWQTGFAALAATSLAGWLLLRPLASLERAGWAARPGPVGGHR
ncbi:MAG: MFS transporter [Chloroflexi bacterium]|nr:MAG: MFS transporter [Chloroflexota bacterium]